VIQDLLPLWLRQRIAGRPNLKAIARNAFWIYLDRGLRLAISLGVGVWVARYLGPGPYGTLQYALAFVSLFGDVAGLGLESVTVRELVRKPGEDGALLGTVMLLRTLGGLAAVLLCFGVLALAHAPGDPARPVAAIFSLLLLLQACDTLEFPFQAGLKANLVVKARFPSALLGAAARVGLILGGFGLLSFAWVGVAETALSTAGVMLAWRLVAAPRGGLRLDWGLGRRLLAESWPLAFAGLAVLIYMKIDQVMLEYMLGSREVGVYAVAAKLSELWYFVPMALAASAYPSIIEARKQSPQLYQERLQKLMDGVALVGWAITLPLAFLAKPLVGLLYGPDYAASAPILVLHVWGGLFVAQGLVLARWLTVEGATRYYMLMTAAGAAVNVSLNLLLIPGLHGRGAAIATVVSYAVPGTLATLFHAKARPLFGMQMKALFYPRPLRRILQLW
jgi:PST family polysaccharide transporter